MTLALRLVLVDSAQCSWCGVRDGRHSTRCYVPQLPGYQPPPAPREPTSRELYSAAVERGETVGHQWSNQK